MKKATHVGELKISEGIILPCAVLEDGTRILSSQGFMKALGRPWRGVYKKDSTGMPNFLAANNLTPFISQELKGVLTPVQYLTPKGAERSGYLAEMLPKVCEVYLQARDLDALLPNQIKIAKACELLMRGLAHVGIIALVDEATGYQADRAKDALEQILSKFISRELSKWVKTFPDEFYEQIFRLRKLSYSDVTKRPSYFGKLTNDVVYARLAPGVLKELKRKTVSSSQRMHQWLTSDFGHPSLRAHLTAAIALMRVSRNWDQFHRMLDTALPKYEGQLELPMDFPDDDMVD
jgi:hypothetical protein